MVTNHLLEEKYRVQKRLEAEAEHDVRVYIENARKIVKDVEDQYNIKFKYGTIRHFKVDDKENLNRQATI